jgi:hypothetical protein
MRLYSVRTMNIRGHMYCAEALSINERNTLPAGMKTVTAGFFFLC